MSEVSNLPYPEELLKCNGQPFGYEAAGALRKNELPDRRTVRSLRDAVKLLCLYAKTDEEYEESLQGIISTFQEKDGVEADWALSDSCYSPQPNILTWIKVSPYKDVAKFVQWNLRRYIDLQRALERDYEEFIDTTIDMTDFLIGQSLFPAEARKCMEKSIEYYGVPLAMDSFEGGAMGAAGYCGDAISIGNLYDDSTNMKGISSYLTGTVFHEYLHGVNSQELGYTQGIDTEVPHGWAEEASVKHAEVVATNRMMPQPEIFNPLERVGELGVYVPERELFAGANIPPDLHYKSFFSEQGSSYRREVEARIVKYFQSINPEQGDEAYSKFSHHYNQLRTTRTKDEFLTKTIEKMYEAQGVEIAREDVGADTGLVVSFSDLR